jgi:predicted O-methyltransferase YrrM
VTTLNTIARQARGRTRTVARRIQEDVRSRSTYQRAVPAVIDPRADAVRAAAKMLARPRADLAFESRRATLHADPTVLSDGRTVGQFVSQSSTAVRWCSFLRELVTRLAPSTALEVGTAAGMASLYIADGMPAGGRFVTYDGWEPALQLARVTLNNSAADLREGWSDDILPDIVAELEPLTFAFVDGGHLEDVTRREWESIRGGLASDALVVWDDIRYSGGMIAVWAEVKREAAWAAEFGNKAVWAA